MDQNSFRRLLQIPRPGVDKSSTTSHSSILGSATSKTKVADPSKPGFKPRKVKKLSDAKYRDRAAERRVGGGNDYAQVEAVLEDFERRTSNSEDKSAIEEQRRYLGGDSDHSILVKGLDVALLEQNKARAALSTEDDDSLEQAFLEVSTDAIGPKKRTREDLVRELKEKRRQKGDGAIESSSSKTVEEEARLLEEAKKKGKFKPIGAPVEGNGKKRKTKGEVKDRQKKKKQKVDVEATGIADGGSSATNAERKGQEDILPPMVPVNTTTVTPVVVSTSIPAGSEQESIEDDLDIFAGAGEYEGIDLGDDDEDEREDEGKQQDPHPEETTPTNKRGQWFATDDTSPLPFEPSQTLGLTRKSRSPAPQPPAEEEVEPEVEQPTRLVPLQTSALPSIKDFLAMDEAAGALEKRRKRKEKRKGGKGGDDEESKKVSAEVKADRDYKRLKSYTEKKAGSSGAK